MVTSAVTNLNERSQPKKPLLPGEKWCPMVRVDVGSEGLTAVNRRQLIRGAAGESADSLNNRCLTTACAVFVGDDTTGYCGLIRS